MHKCGNKLFYIHTKLYTNTRTNIEGECFDFIFSVFNTLFFILKATWATSGENLFIPYANNKGAHPHSLISAFVVRCLDSIIPLLAIADISRPSAVVPSAEQAGLSLNWLQTSKTSFLMTCSHWATTWQNQKCSLFTQRTLISLGILPVWSVFAVHLKKPYVLGYP